MMENEAPKLCSKLHSLLSSCVYPSSANRPSSCALVTDNERDSDIAGVLSPSDRFLLMLYRSVEDCERSRHSGDDINLQDVEEDEARAEDVPLHA